MEHDTDGNTTDPLAAMVEAHLEQEANVPVMVHAVTPLKGGACQDNFRVDVWFGAGPLAGERRLVMRCDAARSLPGSLDRGSEHRVINAAVSAGVATPAARWLAADLPRPGAAATFLDWVDGEAIGRKVVASPALEVARAALPGQLAVNLARIHTITPATHPDLLPVPSDPVADGLSFVRRTLDAMSEARPALELAYGWLARSAPLAREITLVHGDFRTGNFLVRPDGLSAILDWEFAHFGCPEEDLAWIAVRDWRFGRLDQPIGGFAPREPFYEAYERHSGRVVDRAAVHFWEVLGNVRWAAGCVHQGERYLSGTEQDLELLAIARRAAEMEWEALRLIRKGA